MINMLITAAETYAAITIGGGIAAVIVFAVAYMLEGDKR